MTNQITRVEHSHDGERGLVLEVGQPLPPHYQHGRPHGVTVRKFENDRDPIRCVLDNGDVIYIGRGSVFSIS